MKRSTISALLIAFLALCLASLATMGCGKTGGSEVKNGEVNERRLRQDYDSGYAAGYEDGYDGGYADGKKGTYDPEPELHGDWSEEYATGYEEGFLEGYREGHNLAGKESKGEEDELAAVEAAMLAFVKANSAPGMEFRIENIVIHGDEAAGIAVCTSEVLESPLIIMRKGPTGWYGVDFGTGIEPPPWYTY